MIQNDIIFFFLSFVLFSQFLLLLTFLIENERIELWKRNLKKNEGYDMNVCAI